MTNFIAWLCLLVAIIAEVAGTAAMKLSLGFTQFVPSIFIFVFYFISFIFFAFSIKKLDLGMAYATWSGFGTLLISIVGFFIFQETITLLKIVSLLFIIIGVMGLKEP